MGHLRLPLLPFPFLFASHILHFSLHTHLVILHYFDHLAKSRTFFRVILRGYNMRLLQLLNADWISSYWINCGIVIIFILCRIRILDEIFQKIELVPDLTTRCCLHTGIVINIRLTTLNLQRFEAVVVRVAPSLFKLHFISLILRIAMIFFFLVSLIMFFHPKSALI